MRTETLDGYYEALSIGEELVAKSPDAAEGRTDEVSKRLAACDLALSRTSTASDGNPRR